jgi:hypothetical protein
MDYSAKHTLSGHVFGHRCSGNAAWLGACNHLFRFYLRDPSWDLSSLARSSFGLNNYNWVHLVEAEEFILSCRDREVHDDNDDEEEEEEEEEEDEDDDDDDDDGVASADCDGIASWY